jgi:hypothetical protein
MKKPILKVSFTNGVVNSFEENIRNKLTATMVQDLLRSKDFFI